MHTHLAIEQLQSERESWWYRARRKLFHQAVTEALRGCREGRVLDLGCTAELDFEPQSLVRGISVHSSLQVLALHATQGHRNLVCSRSEELAFCSNSLDVVVAGDILQSAPDDLIVLRELRRVLKDGGLLCLTVPAYAMLWGEEDERLGHQRRYTGSELRRKLNTCGFEIQRVSYFVACGFLPLAIDRAAKNIFRTSIMRDRRSARRSGLADAAIVALLDAERALMHIINLPFGTRVVCWARKPALVTERIMVPAWERKWVAPPLPQGSG